MTALQKPDVCPANPNFSSGPCAKRPGWSLENLNDAFLGRSHRHATGKAKLKDVIDRTKRVLGIPDDYAVGIVPGSDTGAIEMAMWSLLGERPVDVLSFESFTNQWAIDIEKQLTIEGARVLKAPYGELPDIGQVNFDHDVVFAWNGTTGGVKVPGGDWIPGDRKGLTLVDATSAVFAMDIPWDKVDVASWSWQKVMGGEAGHGMLALSPRAIARLESYTPAWPLPKVFRMVKKGKFMADVFIGMTINTPSMLCVEDALDGLKWAEGIGGLAALIKRVDANFAALGNWVKGSEWADFICQTPEHRSNTSVVLVVTDPWFQAMDEDAQRAFIKKLTKLLDDEGVAYDIGSHRDAPPGLRIWCGATVEASDIEKLGPWLDWAYANLKTEQAVEA